MGYLSTVGGAFYAVEKSTPEDWATIKLWLQTNMPENVVAFDFDDEAMEMTFNVDWCKWYEDYPEVRAFHDFKCKFTEIFVDPLENREVIPEGAYELIRLGEETEDNEVERSHNNEGRFYINRTIERA